MMDNDKDMAITLLIEGKLSKVAIAKKCGRSRPWLYDNVINDSEMQAEVARRLQIIQTQGMNTIKSHVDRYIENITYLANNSKDEKIVLESNRYLLDHVIGKTTARLEITTDTVDNPVDKKELLEDFEQFNDVIDADIITE